MQTRCELATRTGIRAFRIDQDQATVTVHHADGADEVPRGVRPGAREPPALGRPGADILARVQVMDIGGLFGGIAGFHDLFVRVCRTHD